MKEWTVTDTCNNGQFTVLRRGPSSDLPDVDMGNEEDAYLAAAAPKLYKELRAALMLVRLKYGNTEADIWEWQQEVSELLDSINLK